MFKDHFSDYVVEGDKITCEVDGFLFTARLEYDTDSSVDDYDCYSKSAIKAWRNDEWHFFGLVITAYVDDIEIHDHAASLWGIEGNFPSRRKHPNRYFLEVANELLPEARREAKTRLHHMLTTLQAAT